MSAPHHLIMFVEDDTSLSHALERLLNVAGFDTTSFASAEEYLKVAGQILPSCLIVDIQLPGLSGLEMVDELAKAGPLPPVVFITAHDAPEDRLHASAVGAAAFLTKPFSGRTLVELVRDLISPAATLKNPAAPSSS